MENAVGRRLPAILRARTSLSRVAPTPFEFPRRATGWPAVRPLVDADEHAKNRPPQARGSV